MSNEKIAKDFLDQDGNPIDGQVDSIVAGDNVNVDATDPVNPIVSAEPSSTITTIDASGGDKGKADLAGGVRQFELTLTEAATLLPLNVPATGGVYFALVLKQDGTGGHAFTPPANTRWDGGTVPTFSTLAGSRDSLLFFTDDGGATYDGFVAGIGMA